MIAYHKKRKYRLRVTYFLLIAVILPVTCFGVGGICMAAENVCEKLLSKKISIALSSGQIKHLQESLEAMGYAPEKIDGIMGPLTRAALKNYCDEFEKEFRKESIDEFIAKLALYAAIAKDYPQWKEIVKNEKFKLWIDQQPVGEKVAYHIIMRTWTAKDIISLFKQYEKDQTKSKSPEKKQNIVSYKLTKSDLDELQAEKKITGKLADLKDKSYDSKEEFIDAVRKILGMQDNESVPYKELIIKSSKIDTYTLTKESIDKLADNKIPSSLIDGLTKLKDKEFQGKDTFKTEIEAIIEKAIQFEKYQPMLLKYAKVEGPYRISEEYLKKLRGKNVPAYVIAKLRTLPKEPYPDINAFKKAVLPIIEDVTKKDNFPDPAITRFGRLRDKVPKKQREGADIIVRKEREDYIDYQRIIIQEIDELPLYKLTDQAENKLKKADVPEFLIVKLRDLKNKGYSDEEPFLNALNKEIAALVKFYRDRIADIAEKTSAYQLTKRSLKDLKVELERETLPNTVLEKLRSLQDIEYPNKKLFVNALAVNTCEIVKYESLILEHAEIESADRMTKYKLTEKSFKELEDKQISGSGISKLQKLEDKEYECKAKIINALKAIPCETYESRSLIVEKAEKSHGSKGDDNEHKSINWNAGSCGTVLDDLSGVVYGFYPFWIAADKASQGEKEKSGEQIGEETQDQNEQNGNGKILKQELDFSVLSRIGYYFLSFDENGVLYKQLPWRPKENSPLSQKKREREAAKFLREARDHRTDLDLVIYQNVWESWSQMTGGQKWRVFDKLQSNIVNLASIKLTDSFSRIKPYVTFGRSSTPTIADGITLYFVDFPDDKDSKDSFLKFLKKLRKNLKASNKNYHLNIMLHMDALGKGIYEFELLKNIIPLKEKGEDGYEDQDDVDHYLVFIGEPTTDTKKALRNKVENLFEGAQRSNMLQKVIPVLTPTGDDEQQFIDDIVYAKQNFGGIGFWKLPISEGEGVGFGTCLAEVWPWHKTKQIKNETPADLVNDNLKKHYRMVGAPPVSGLKNFVVRYRWEGRIFFDLLVIWILIFILLCLLKCRFRMILWPPNYWWILIFFIFLLFLLMGGALLSFDPSWKNLAEGNTILAVVLGLLLVIGVFLYVKKSKQGEIP